MPPVIPVLSTSLILHQGSPGVKGCRGLIYHTSYLGASLPYGLLRALCPPDRLRLPGYRKTLPGGEGRPAQASSSMAPSLLLGSEESLDWEGQGIH